MVTQCSWTSHRCPAPLLPHLGDSVCVAHHPKDPGARITLRTPLRTAAKRIPALHSLVELVLKSGGWQLAADGSLQRLLQACDLHCDRGAPESSAVWRGATC